MKEKEIENVIKLSPFERYKYFIKRIADFEKIYILVDDSENYAISSVDSFEMLSFWSAKEFAEREAIAEWENYVVKEIGLTIFYEKIVSYIRHNKYLLNIFPVNGKSGFIVDIDEFLSDLQKEIEIYE